MIILEGRVSHASIMSAAKKYIGGGEGTFNFTLALPLNSPVQSLGCSWIWMSIKTIKDKANYEWAHTNIY